MSNPGTWAGAPIRRLIARCATGTLGTSSRRDQVTRAEREARQEHEAVVAEMTAAKAFPEPIVTAVEPVEEFHAAEGYHQNYYNENSRQPYCMFVISPKLAKLEKKFAEKLRA